MMSSCLTGRVAAMQGVAAQGVTTQPALPEGHTSH